jgi:GNAT superfamily N-acetyltransferase
VIRLAGPEDAAAIAGVQVRGWWRAYAEYVDVTRFGTVEEREQRWRERLGSGAAGAPGEPAVLVWDESGLLGGFCVVGPAREAEDPPVGEVHALYVDPPAQGAGVGSALLVAGEGMLAEELGFAAAVLWVFEANAPARAFYEHKGWTLDGGPRDERWAPEVRYRRALR